MEVAVRVRPWLRWFAALMIGLLIGASIIAAFVIYLSGRQESALQFSQRLAQAASTMFIGGLYFWREYLRRDQADHAPRHDCQARATAAASAEASSAPQIIQNIYPPSLTSVAPPPAYHDSSVQAASDSEPPVIVVRAERFELIDREGRERAALMVDDRGAATLRILDRSGRRRINLAVGADGFGELVLTDAAGTARIELGTPGDDAYAYLAMRGKRTYLLAADGLEVTETMWNEADQREWSAPIGPRRN
jgi:hypothetical protein